MSSQWNPSARSCARRFCGTPVKTFGVQGLGFRLTHSQSRHGDERPRLGFRVLGGLACEALLPTPLQRSPLADGGISTDGRACQALADSEPLNLMTYGLPDDSSKSKPDKSLQEIRKRTDKHRSLSSVHCRGAVHLLASASCKTKSPRQRSDTELDSPNQAL